MEFIEAKGLVSLNAQSRRRGRSASRHFFCITSTSDSFSPFRFAGVQFHVPSSCPSSALPLEALRAASSMSSSSCSPRLARSSSSSSIATSSSSVAFKFWMVVIKSENCLERTSSFSSTAVSALCASFSRFSSTASSLLEQRGVNSRLFLFPHYPRTPRGLVATAVR
jgi:hypothetical protein